MCASTVPYARNETVRFALHAFNLRLCPLQVLRSPCTALFPVITHAPLTCNPKRQEGLHVDTMPCICACGRRELKGLTKRGLLIASQQKVDSRRTVDRMSVAD